MATRLVKGRESARGYAAGRKAQDAMWTKHAEQRVRHFLHLLGHDEMPTPRIVFVDRSGVSWLGRCTVFGRDITAHLHQGVPLNTLVELQRAILGDEATFERVLAHEVCHHVEFLTFSRGDMEGVLHGYARTSHGHRFLELAGQINQALGDPKFVTIKSDASDRLSQAEKPYWLYIQSARGPHPLVKSAPPNALGWKWAIKLDERKKAWLRAEIEKGAGILVETRERYWSMVPQAKIGQPVVSIPHDENRIRELADLVRLTDPAWSLALLRPKLGELPPDPRRR